MTGLVIVMVPVWVRDPEVVWRRDLEILLAERSLAGDGSSSWRSKSLTRCRWCASSAGQPSTSISASTSDTAPGPQYSH